MRGQVVWFHLTDPDPSVQVEVKRFFGAVIVVIDSQEMSVAECPVAPSRVMSYANVCLRRQSIFTGRCHSHGLLRLGREDSSFHLVTTGDVSSLGAAEDSSQPRPEIGVHLHLPNAWVSTTCPCLAGTEQGSSSFFKELFLL